MRQKLLKVMPVERLEYLLSLGDDNINALEHMTASELIGGANDGLVRICICFDFTFLY